MTGRLYFSTAMSFDRRYRPSKLYQAASNTFADLRELQDKESRRLRHIVAAKRSFLIFV